MLLGRYDERSFAGRDGQISSWVLTVNGPAISVLFPRQPSYMPLEWGMIAPLVVQRRVLMCLLSGRDDCTVSSAARVLMCLLSGHSERDLQQQKCCQDECECPSWVGTVNGSAMPVLFTRWLSICLLSGRDECTVSSATANADVPLELARWEGLARSVMVPGQVWRSLLSGHSERACDVGTGPTATLNIPLSGVYLSTLGRCGQARLQSCGGYQSAYSTGESCPEPTQAVKPLELF